MCATRAIPSTNETKPKEQRGRNAKRQSHHAKFMPSGGRSHPLTARCRKCKGATDHDSSNRHSLRGTRRGDSLRGVRPIHDTHGVRGRRLRRQVDLHDRRGGRLRFLQDHEVTIPSTNDSQSKGKRQHNDRTKDDSQGFLAQGDYEGCEQCDRFPCGASSVARNRRAGSPHLSHPSQAGREGHDADPGSRRDQERRPLSLPRPRDEEGGGSDGEGFRAQGPESLRRYHLRRQGQHRYRSHRREGREGIAPVLRYGARCGAVV